jgi:hypothetical protein
MSTIAPQQPDSSRLHPRIEELLERTRHAIRRYVCIEGVALAVACLIGLFWVGMAIDYLPVKLGSKEMPVKARAVLLFLILAVLLFVIYRWILQRMLVRLRDNSLALLIERRFPEFHDGLVTAVEVGRHVDPDANPDLLERSRDEAVELVDLIDIQELFDYRALMRAVTLAAALLLSVLMFAVYSGPTFRMGLSRLFALSAAPYPRSTQIELIGFDENNELVVARGDDVKVRVRADATRNTAVPTVCTIYYETGDGERGRVNMSRLGEPRDGYQQYAYEGMPFTNILSNIEFDVVGNDHRLHNCQVRVVESPQIAGIELQYQLPAYTGLLARNETYRPGIQLAQGSKVQLKVHTNKSLRRAEIKNLDTGELTVFAATESDKLVPKATSAQDEVELTQQIVPEIAQQNSFSYELDNLLANVAQEIRLLDTDGTASRRPYQVVITATPDEPPRVDTRLRGIGSAITPDARIPIEGDIQDDYGIDRSWITLELGGTETLDFPIVLDATGQVDTALDLRKQRAESARPFELQVDSKITISIHSQDRFDLSENPNIGDGDRYGLDVVTPSRLLALLEARELGLRRRFEQIISDFRETRDSLSRVQFRAADLPGGVGETRDAELETNDGRETEDDPARLAARARALRLLRVQRAAQQSQRASQEVIGVALSFDDVREELINNRVDSADRQRRLKFDISEPLKGIGNKMFPDLVSSLNDLEQRIDNVDEGAAFVSIAVRRADELLVAMERVLQKMLDLESYNELVDLVRSMIREQDVLIEETKKQQKKRALDLLK